MKHIVSYLDINHKPKEPLPTLDQFRRAHESLWMRPVDLAAYEQEQETDAGSRK